MELFTRDMVLAGPLDEVRPWATDIARAYTAATDRELMVWTSVAGGAAGHFTWSMSIDGAAEVIELGAKATADADYRAMVERGRPYFVGAPRDTIYRSMMPTPERDLGAGSVAVVTTASAKAGSLGHAVGWGIEMAEHVTRTQELPTALMRTALGSFSRLTWMAIAPDAATADEADRALNSDDEYLKLLARGGAFFVSGSARTQLFLRLA